MSLRNLPAIQAFTPPHGVQSDAPTSALEKWDHLVMAAEAPNTIGIFEGIGEQWDGSGMTAKRMSGILRSIGAKDVTVSINSPGGDFFEGIAIYNILREHDGKVVVRIPGLAASAASIIAMAGDEIQIAKAGFLMIHNAWSVVVGNRHDLKDAIKVLEPFDAAMADVYASRSGMEVRKVEKMMDSDTWIAGSDAVQMGLADALLPADSKASAAAASPRVMALRRMELALAKQGVPRSQRREMLIQLSEGTLEAAPLASGTLETAPITREADLVVAMQSLLSHINTGA